jgi:hypothetical protein
LKNPFINSFFGGSGRGIYLSKYSKYFVRWPMIKRNRVRIALKVVVVKVEKSIAMAVINANSKNINIIA